MSSSRSYWRRFLCKIKGHKLTGPEHEGRLLCSRCGRVFDAELLRQFDEILRSKGEKGLL